jgi:hypothetical protein
VIRDKEGTKPKRKVASHAAEVSSKLEGWKMLSFVSQQESLAESTWLPGLFKTNPSILPTFIKPHIQNTRLATA